jgi:hypothetical protein
VTAILPPVRTAASYQILPDGCCCTWAWRTSVMPWQWVRTDPHPLCRLHSPQGGSEGETA